MPFAWETAASGIAAPGCRRPGTGARSPYPPDWAGQRIVLHFGAVHHEATVWVNGTEVARHAGGYTPFESDVTDALRDGRARDPGRRVAAPADKREIAHGKQRSIPRDDYDGVSFTPSSGIWQSVWLEARGRNLLLAEVCARGEGLDGIASRPRGRRRRRRSG